MASKQLTLLLVALIVLGAIAIAVRAVVNNNIQPQPTPSFSVSPFPTETPTICTMDAKMCPDGSYVGRVPPNCDFKMCPVATSTGVVTGKFEVGLNEKTKGEVISLTPKEVLEDSRCPIDVECVWAGTVRLSVNVSQDGVVTTRIMKLNEATVFSTSLGDVTVTLVNVLPTRSSRVRVLPGDYRFTFEVKK